MYSVFHLGLVALALLFHVNLELGDCVCLRDLLRSHFILKLNQHDFNAHDDWSVRRNTCCRLSLGAIRHVRWADKVDFGASSEANEALFNAWHGLSFTEMDRLDDVAPIVTRFEHFAVHEITAEMIGHFVPS